MLPTVRQTPPIRDWNTTVCQGSGAPVAARGLVVTGTRPPTGAVAGAEMSTFAVAGVGGHAVLGEVRPCAVTIERSRSGWSVVTPDAPRSMTRCSSAGALAVQVPTKMPRARAWFTVSAVRLS